MKLGILFAGAEPLSEMITVARLAETAGFGALRMVEAYRSAWVALTALAGVTTRMDLGPWVLNAYARSPLMTGLTAQDFQELSGGRLTLAIGGGNRHINEVWQGIPHARVLTKLADTLRILRLMGRARAGERIQWQGAVHRIDWRAIHAGLPAPLYLAAIFPAMLRVAARHADGIAGGATLSPDYLSERMQPMTADFAVDGGRDPVSLRWKAVLFAAVSEDLEAARSAARLAIAGLFHPLPHPYYAYTLREQGYGRVVDRLESMAGQVTTDGLAREIPDELIDRCCLVGSPATCAARVHSYAPLLEELILLNVLPGSTPDRWQSLLSVPRQLNP